MRYYYDIEQQEYIPESELRAIYNQLRTEQPDNYDYSFLHFISNCLTQNNGSLESVIIRKNKLVKEIFDFMSCEYDTETDFTEEIESRKKEIAYIDSLLEGGK